MGRAPCCDKNGLKKGPWTTEEDQKLIDYIKKHGYGNWRTLPKNAGLQRCGKSCRLRWTNYLKPDIKRGRFSFEEEETIIQLHSILGNKWSAIAARLPGRTDNEIKNYWNTHIRKRLLRMGIDPVTHSPRLDLLDLSSILNSSLYNQTQYMSARLLGVQPLVNPELLKLAASIVSSQNENQTQNHGLVLDHNQISGWEQNQFDPAFVQSNQVQEFPTGCDGQQFPSNFENLGEWQGKVISPSSLTQDYVPLTTNYNCYETIMDHPSSETSNFGFGSVLSTPSSSPTPLNSNSTYFNGSSTEDEREISYCSNILKFEIPDIFDVNDFM